MKKLKKVEYFPKILLSPLFTYIIKGRNDPLPISQGALSTLHPRFRLYPALRVSHNTLRASFTAFPAPRVLYDILKAENRSSPAPRVLQFTICAA